MVLLFVFFFFFSGGVNIANLVLVYFVLVPDTRIPLGLRIVLPYFPRKFFAVRGSSFIEGVHFSVKGGNFCLHQVPVGFGGVNHLPGGNPLVAQSAFDWYP